MALEKDGTETIYKTIQEAIVNGLWSDVQAPDTQVMPGPDGADAEEEVIWIAKAAGPHSIIVIWNSASLTPAKHRIGIAKKGALDYSLPLLGNGDYRYTEVDDASRGSITLTHWDGGTDQCFPAGTKFKVAFECQESTEHWVQLSTDQGSTSKTHEIQTGQPHGAPAAPQRPCLSGHLPPSVSCPEGDGLVYELQVCGCTCRNDLVPCLRAVVGVAV